MQSPNHRAESEEWGRSGYYVEYNLTSPCLFLSQLVDLQMTSANRNTSDGEEGEEIEIEPLNPPLQTETADRVTASVEEAIGVVEDEVGGADIGKYGGSEDPERGEAGAESVENDSDLLDLVRCRI